MDPDEISKMFESWDSSASGSTSSYTQYKPHDLSRISTRDLLNECYRRRAIEKFDYNVNADLYFLKQEPEARAYVIQDLMRGMWSTMLKNEKFSTDAINIKEKVNDLQLRTEFFGEVYICKHPTKVRK